MNKVLAIRFVEYMKEYSDDPVTRYHIIQAFVQGEKVEQFLMDYVFTDNFQLGLTTLAL